MVKWDQNCFFGINSLCKVRVIFLGELLLEKTVFSVRQKGVPPLLLPASVLQLPRCLVRICNLFHINHKITNLTVSKNAIAAGKTNCEIQFAPQMWATRPHLGSIFEKLLHRKTFWLPAARILQPLFSHNKKAPFYKDAFR